MNASQALARAAALPIWTKPGEPRLLGGGITNFNVVIEDLGQAYVVRIGDDIPVHGVMRFNEHAISRAAHAAGIAPAVRHAEPGVLVLDYLDARPLVEADVRAPDNLSRIIDMVRHCHREVPRHLVGPILTFWVFHVLRDYAATLRRDGSPYTDRLADLTATAEALEAAVGPVDLVLGHNDLLPANILDDGERLWLIDWEYGGFNSPLFDLGGLATNNGLDSEQERGMLEHYFETSVDTALWHRYTAMKCASLMRETMWSMVSEIHSVIDFDYAEYTTENFTRLEAALRDFRSL